MIRQLELKFRFENENSNFYSTTYLIWHHTVFDIFIQQQNLIWKREFKALFDSWYEIIDSKKKKLKFLFDNMICNVDLTTLFEIFDYSTKTDNFIWQLYLKFRFKKRELKCWFDNWFEVFDSIKIKEIEIFIQIREFNIATLIRRLNSKIKIKIFIRRLEQYFRFVKYTILIWHFL